MTSIFENATYGALFSTFINDGKLSMAITSSLLNSIWGYVYENRIAACKKDTASLYNAFLGYKRRNTSDQSGYEQAYCIGQLDMLFLWLQNLAVVNEQVQLVKDDEHREPLKHIDAILAMLTENYSLTASQIAFEVGLSRSALSNTLKRYKERNLIESEKIGKYVFYSLTEKGKRIWNEKNAQTEDSHISRSTQQKQADSVQDAVSIPPAFSPQTGYHSSKSAT